MAQVFRKDPDAMEDFTLFWSPQLEGQTIASSVWIVPAGITEGANTKDATSTTIRLSGGTEASDYVLTNRITTPAGRSYDETVTIRVRSTSAVTFPIGSEIISMLPGNTSVTSSEAQRFVDAAISRLARNHAGTLPETDETTSLVGEMAYARALKLHFLKGEGAIEVPAAEKELDRADTAFSRYDTAHVSPTERPGPVRIVSRLRR